MNAEIISVAHSRYLGGISGGCFTNISRALQNILSKFVYRRNRTSYENFKLKLCMCAQSHALGTHTKFRLEILTLKVISSIVDFREIILESSRNVSETTPRFILYVYCVQMCLTMTSNIIYYSTETLREIYKAIH